MTKYKMENGKIIMIGDPNYTNKTIEVVDNDKITTCDMFIKDTDFAFEYEGQIIYLCEVIYNFVFDM